MDSKHEKDVDSASVSSAPKTRVEFYDPSKESVWTRVGLTFESFKRAPGTTGYVFQLVRVYLLFVLTPP
jgi:amino acid transporter